MNAWQKACRKRFVRHAFSCPVFESKKRGNIRMLAIFLAPVYILANVFTAYWLLRWMKEVHPLFRHPAVLGVILVLYAFFALCSTLCLEYPGVFILFILCDVVCIDAWLTLIPVPAECKLPINPAINSLRVLTYLLFHMHYKHLYLCSVL